MPKVARSDEEINVVRGKMLDEALDLIREYGYEGFSMRKLGHRLGIAAKTIYNYFKNKDEIYLHVLTKGFELLFEAVTTKSSHIKDPFKRLEAATVAFLDFGLKKSNYYDIMLTWYVPKYNDFIKTPLEPLAYKELQTALQTADYITKIIEDLSMKSGRLEPGKARLLFIQWLVCIHGTIALSNNTILSYIHDQPETILKQLALNNLQRFRP